MQTESKSRYYKEFSVKYLDTTCIWQHVGSPFPHGEPIPFVDAETSSDYAQLGMRSPSHHRATVEIAEDNTAFWTIEPNGIPYSVREWKGNTFPDFADISIYMGDELRNVVSLQDALDTVEAIEWIRAIGLPTETVGSIHKVQTVQYQGKEISIDDARDITLDKLKKQSVISSVELHRHIPLLVSALSIPSSMLFEETIFKSITSKGLSKEVLVAYFDAYLHHENIQSTHTFLQHHADHAFELAVMERYFPVGERLGDMNYIRSKKQYIQFLTPVFDVLNAISETYGNCIPELSTPLPFDVQHEEDIVRYFVKYLPTQLATYLSILHENSLAHCNIRASNISALGFPVDPDTVIGIQNGKTRGDVYKLYESMYQDIIDSAYTLHKATSNYNFSVFGKSVSKTETECVAQFIAVYIKRRQENNPEFASSTLESKIIYDLKSMLPSQVTARNAIAMVARINELLGA